MVYWPTVIYRIPGEPRENSVLRYIGNRILSENKNFLCAMTGGTGQGKSWCAISMAEMYSKMFDIPFDAEIHILHSLKQILQLITQPELERKVRIGSILVIEELQVEANARGWQSEHNQSLNRIVSTFRDKRLCVLFTTPVMSFIDKQSRLLFHGEFKVKGFDKNTKITTVMPRFLEPKNSPDEFYRKRLIVKYAVEEKEKLQRMLLSNWHVPKASDNILALYEAKKKKFNDDLNKSELKRLELHEQQVTGQNKSVDFLKVIELFRKYGEDYIKISAEMPHISPMALERMVKMIKRTYKRAGKGDAIA